MRKWRKSRRAALGKETRGKFSVLVRRERPIKWMLGEISLHDDFSRKLRAPRPAGDLKQQRGEPLRGAEICTVKRVVGAEHADEREIREIVSLRQHLRAHQNVDQARVDAIA